jgi:hypothetical protein
VAFGRKNSVRLFAETFELLERVRRDPESITQAEIGIRGLSLADLKECCNLESLTISGSYHTGAHPDWADTICDFSDLRFLPALRTLAIHDCRHFDGTQLAIVSSIPVIRSLSITTFMPVIKKYDELRSNPHLRVLQLTCVSDLSFLHGLPNLEHLFVSDKWALRPLRNLQALCSLSQLKSLSVNSRHHKSLAISTSCPLQFTYDQDARESEWWKQRTGIG